MAAVNSKALKRVSDQILAAAASAGRVGGASPRDPSRLLSFTGRYRSSRRSYSSSYEKEIEEQVRPAVVPDYVIDPGHGSDKYWGPHPRTGVFGPASAAVEKDAGGEKGAAAVPPPPGLEQTVRYRPLEDVDKPAYQ